MDQQKNKSFFLAFVVVWGGLILWNLFTPAKKFSEAENRYLKAFPQFSVDDLLDGDFMDGVNTYLNDQFAGREYWVSAQTLMEYGLGKREVNQVFLGNNALLGNLSPADAGRSETNIAGINAFAARYKLPTYVVLVPSSTAVQPQNLPAFAQGWDEEAYIAEVNAQFSDGVTPLSVFDVLRQHREEYIYYHTDHHWTSYGAYLAYTQLAPAMGLPARERQDFEISTVNTGFYGTYHSKTGYPLVKADVIEVYTSGQAAEYVVFDGAQETEYPSIYFEDYLEKKDKYSYFLGQVQPYVTVRTASASGKKLIVFKDSYAHCVIPMLLEDYSEIRLVDLRFINQLDFDQLLHISDYDEALFLYSTDVFSHQAGPSKLRNDVS